MKLLHLLPLLCAALTAAIIVLLVRTRASRALLDVPNQRSLHTNPTPRIGGLAMFLVLAPALPLLGFGVLALLAAALSALSFFDDRYGLPIALRFGAHAVAAVAFIATSTLTPPLQMVFVVVTIMWMTNLYNFMDGSDGLAGGMTLIGFAFYAVAAATAGQENLALAAACIACAAAGFLYFNFPPAKIFLGDAGSIPLGFLAAAMGYQGWQTGVWGPGFPVVVFAPFILDASATLFRRAVRKEKVWKAHRTHYYQRVIQLGWTHRKTALVAYALMLVSGLTGLALLPMSSAVQTNVLLLLTLFYMVLAFLIDRTWGRKNKQNDSG
jgi:UDP-N-acetylmuramyl pentapeptide phosphotransferase/UDP-N-acetylglucosamine-1-phosphate transferase